MANPSDKVFLLKGEELSPLAPRPMRAGLCGKTLEDAMQTLLQRHPQLIPGKQIDPVSEEPPRFVLLRREMPLAGLSVDLLYLDQRGILTLVETKLFQNPESRREVIGQIIEYAANASDAWGSGKAREYAAEYWDMHDKHLDEIMREHMGTDIDIDDIWNNVDDNLQRGRIRVIIATDELRPEVRRMIEYLNREMQNAEVLGLELRCYGESESPMVLVPRVVGLTQEAIDRRRSGGGEIPWDVEKLRAEYRKMSNPDLRRRLLNVLEFAHESKLLLTARTKRPSFGLSGNNGRRLVSFFLDGAIYVYMNEDCFAGGESERDQFVNDLKRLGMLEPSMDAREVVSGRNLLRKLVDLDDEDLAELLELFRSYCSSP